MLNDSVPAVVINDALRDSGVAIDRDVRELLIPYLEGILVGTEYEGKMTVISQNAVSDGENTIVVGVENEKDVMNAYNGKVGHEIDFETCLETIYFRHDRDINIIIEINMGDNDALWMFSKYVSMCIAQDMVKLTSSGKMKIAQFPANMGITVKDMGSRKIWTCKLLVIAKMANIASMEAEIY